MKVELNKEQMQQLEDEMFERFKSYVDEQWQQMFKILEYQALHRLSKELHFTKEDKLKYECIRKIMDYNIYDLLKEIENDEKK